MSLKIIAPAEAELREATKWYAERDPRVAERFTAEVRHALQLIESLPNMGARVPGVADLTIRRFPVRTFPYHLVFITSTDHIEVIAFAHDRRRPGYFLSRVRG